MLAVGVVEPVPVVLWVVLEEPAAVVMVEEALQVKMVLLTLVVVEEGQLHLQLLVPVVPVSSSSLTLHKYLKNSNEYCKC